MADLPDDLRALLHERAEHAAAIPAPTDALVRRVRRRRATRAGVAVTASVAGVVALGLGAAAVVPTQEAARVASTPSPEPSPTKDVTVTPGGDKYEFCDFDHVDPYPMVAVHPTELKFAQGCYVARQNGGQWSFSNPQQTVHDVVIIDDNTGRSGFSPGKVLTTWPALPTQEQEDSVFDFPLPVGDYSLTCSFHPEMRGQLIIVT